MVEYSMSTNKPIVVWVLLWTDPVNGTGVIGVYDTLEQAKLEQAEIAADDSEPAGRGQISRQILRLNTFACECCNAPCSEGEGVCVDCLKGNCCRCRDITTYEE